MRQLNNVKITVFIKENEDEVAHLNVLKSFVPFEIEKEKISVNRIDAEGVEGNKIVILELFLQKESHTNKFLDHFLSTIGIENRKILFEQRGTRIDEEFNFFVRFEKEALFSGRYELIDGGNCFHVKMNLACFPKKRDAALILIEKIFKK